MGENRRSFLRDCTLLAAGSLFASKSRLSSFQQEEQKNVAANAVVVDPEPLFEISPYLYMQFMEPLGVTDGSVEAAWDYGADDWRSDLIEVVKDLSPDVVRWGGTFTKYYKWREAASTFN